MSGDHPRTRGVYPFCVQCRTSFHGSSPHARGLRGAGTAIMVLTRIIPARAGFTFRGFGLFGARTDHPRTRGVYSSKFAVATLTEGSSPHARGLPHEVRRRLNRCGIIPARAGFTALGKRGSPARSGSSPHARGLLHTLSTGASSFRIIPARAGFTLSPISRYRGS